MLTFDFVEEVCDWNIERDNLRYDRANEYAMLAEEVEEYMEASVLYSEVGEADALADTAVVAIGGLIKLCRGNKQKVYDILLAVTSANNLKNSTKNSAGKITKPKGFVGPEKIISRILGKYSEG